MKEYHIHQVLYKFWIDQEARIATNSKKRIPIILEKHIRSRISESSKKEKDIGIKVLGSVDTGFKTDKEGVIGKYSLDELIIRIKTQKK